MPVAVTYPGVYLEEISSGVRTITGVATSIAAFVDTFPSGPLNKAVSVGDFGEFERVFGGLSASSEASYGLLQFFLNGGSSAYVVRVTSATHPAVAASVTLLAAPGGSPALVVTAANPGAWGNDLRLDVDYDTADSTTMFNLTVRKTAVVNGVRSTVATETFRNLVIDPAQPNDATAVVNAASQLVTLSGGVTGARPAQTGSASAAFSNSTVPGALAAGQNISAAIGSAPAQTTTAGLTLPSSPGVGDVAAAVQTLLRTKVPNATVTVAGNPATNAYLIVKSGGPGTDVVTLGDAVGTELGFDANVQEYALGATNAAAQGASTAGDSGQWQLPADAAGIATALIGDENAKTGMYALRDVDLFNILCIPATANLPDTSAAQVAAQATQLCTAERAMYIVDPPQTGTPSRDTPAGITGWLGGTSLRSRNSALYAPRVKIADPLNQYRLRTVANSGTLAGVWASTDAARGVWKAPAGTSAVLAGVQDLAYNLTDAENGVLNPLGINALRSFPVTGKIAWGARTTIGADQLADDYKYIPVRRLALYIEESLFRGTQWVVFEPNDAPLWAQIRLNVGAFMQLLFAQGAFAGTTPQQAYFVQCDDKTNPQASINLGIVNVVVGFAPLKPAEFVVIQIQQIAGTIAS
jgi:uncharacterized protein